ncbi:MAG: hypothetical protein AB1601_03920 [Planctomycetota bacterium]
MLALTTCNGELIVGSTFTKAGDVSALGIARWNGSTWQPLGPGMGPTNSWYVYDLTVYNSELIAGGDFTTAGGVVCNHIARWNGNRWQALGSGMGGNNNHPYVYALTVYNDELIAGGEFTTAGGLASAHWARWGCKVCPGDLNCDGVVRFDDINPFVLALSNWTEWRYTYAGCPERNADVNGDGQYGGLYGFGDINPFVELLAGAGGQPIPCARHRE